MKKGAWIAAILSAALLAGCAPSARTDETADSVSSGSVTPSAQTSATAEGTADAAAAWQQIAPEDALALLETQGVVLLDVRTPEEFAEGHIEGAQLLPYDEIAARTDELPADKDTTIVVYCRSGRRSAIAAEELADMGYTAVYDLGGIQSWPYDTVTG